ncbi:hypothetical protein [Robertkochia solimangrovi]|uniref:hypothetical protein n=1 Tax=Robertkochia solimangrovi TaxID=2213046 RepID=UPI00117D9EF1|nr:hypothetical protein [Robertkochia solimangrovi]
MVGIQSIESNVDHQSERVKKYIILWCSKGHFSLEMDNKSIILRKYQVLTITSGKHSVSTKTGCILFQSIPEEVILL